MQPPQFHGFGRPRQRHEIPQRTPTDNNDPRVVCPQHGMKDRAHARIWNRLVAFDMKWRERSTIAKQQRSAR